MNTAGTRAQPEDTTNNTVRAERAHYFEVGSYHALNRYATLQFTGWYKLSNFLSDAGQFGTTPLLNYFAFERGWQRGIDGALKLQLSENLTARGNVAWGQCKGYGLQSGHFLLEAEGDHGYQFTERGVLRSHADDDKFGDCELSAPGADDDYRADVVCVGIAYSGERRGQDQFSHSPSYTVYNFSIAHVFPLPWEGQKFLVGVRYHQSAGPEIFHQPG